MGITILNQHSWFKAKYDQSVVWDVGCWAQEKKKRKITCGWEFLNSQLESHQQQELTSGTFREMCAKVGYQDGPPHFEPLSITLFNILGVTYFEPTWGFCIDTELTGSPERAFLLEAKWQKDTLPWQSPKLNDQSVPENVACWMSRCPQRLVDWVPSFHKFTM